MSSRQKPKPHGRPRTGPRSEAVIFVRVSTAEHEAIKRAAVVAERHVGEWVRMRALEAARK